MKKLILFLSLIAAIGGCTKDSSQSTTAPDQGALTQSLLDRRHHQPWRPPAPKPPVPTPVPPPPPVTPPPVVPPVTPPVVPPGNGVVPTYPANGLYNVSAVINWTGQSNKTISGVVIDGGSKPCISLTNCTGIHITLSHLRNSTSGNGGIFLTGCSNITIDYNVIENVGTGVYAETDGAGIVVNYNRFHNMQGPYPRGQYVQFNNVSGSGLSVSYNRGDNILGSSYPEDCINMYMSNGTAASPIQIVGNWIKGGGPSPTGGGILLGDNGGNYQYAANNILVDPGQYGMSISGGDHNSLVNNQIYAAAQSFTNVGLDVFSQKGNLSVLPLITNATVSGNQVNYMSGRTGTNFLNPYWISPVDSTPAGWSTNNWKATITASILPNSY